MTQARYRLTGRLESGELAELYQATRDDREKVVIKLFHPRTSDERYARVIADTVHKLSPLKDEAVVRVIDVGLARGRLAIVREYVDGFTLGQALQRLLTKEVLISPALALYIVIQLLEAANRAHEAGVVHGAITPGNVLLGKDGRVALGDFGALSALHAVPELKTFTAKGRGAYRAQEVAQGETPSAVSDVYSLGAIAYELLTLKEAVRATKTVSTRHEPLPPPSRLDRRINGRLDPIIMRAVELSPQRRFKSCIEYSTALRNFLGASGGMPSRADLGRLVADLFPNEVSIQISKEVPFADPISLSEVSGAVLPKGAPVKEQLLMARPSFSGGELPAIDDEYGRPGAETIEGMPAFEAYKGDESSARPAEEPNFDDGTAPGAAGPLERGWVAPPGAAPIRKKQAGTPLGSGAVSPSMNHPGLKSRFRVVEDFGGPDEPRIDDVTDTRADPRARDRDTAPAPVPVKKEKEKERSDMAMPPQSELFLTPSEANVPLVKEPGGRRRKMLTEERVVWRSNYWRKRALAIAAGVAVVGLFCFGLVIWRFGKRPPSSRPDPADRGGVVTKKATATEPGPIAPPSTRDGDSAPLTLQPESDEEPAGYAAPKGNVAFLSVQSNTPARIFIDGKKLPRTTPLKRFKVEAGTRKIVLESVRTGERKELSAKLVKGKEAKFFEQFEVPGR